MEFARRNDVIVVHDNAYSEITYDGYRAPSFLETPGAMDVGIEIFSLSKSYNMTGWRAGAVVGNRDLVGAYWQLKTNIDSGMFEALQEAAAAALRSDGSSVAEMCAIYQRRRDVLVAALRAIGLRVDPPKGAIYVWARVPDGDTSASFTERVLEDAAVVISPGAAYGPERRGLRAHEPDGGRRAPQRGRRADRRARLSAGVTPELPVRVLRPGGRLPARAHPGDAGLDLAAAAPCEIAPGRPRGRAARASPSRSRPATPAWWCPGRGWRAGTG